MKVKCPKCGNIMDVTSLERPLQVKCPVCNTIGVLKAKPQQPQYVPPITPYQPQYPSYPSYPSYPPPPPAWYPEKKKTNISLAAGILLIIAGVLAIGTWGFIMIGAGEIATLYGETGLASFLIICGAIGFVLSIFPLLGGIMAVKKTHWGVALAGSIIGLFTIGPWIGISSILSLIALILIAVSKEEFR